MIFRHFFAALLPWLCLFAGTQGAKTLAEEMETITVSGTQATGSSIADVNPESYNGFSIVIERDNFSDRLVELQGILDEQVSVQTFSTGGAGNFSAVSVRGSTGKQVNVFVDGLLLNSALSGGANLSLLPTSIIEGIEIYPDFTPVQLSDANLAGAINLRTRALASDGNGGKLGAGIGSFGTWRLEGSYWGGNHDTQVIAATSLNAADNDFPVSEEDFPQLTAGKSTTRQNAAFHQGDLFTKLRQRIGDALLLHWMLNYNESDNELPTIQNRTEPAATLTSNNLRNTLTLESARDNHNWGVRLYHTTADARFRDLFQSLSLQAQHIEQEEGTLGTQVFYEGHLGPQTLSLAMDASQADINKHNHQANRAAIGAEREKLVLSFSDQWSATDRLALYGLWRAYHVNDISDAGKRGFASTCSGQQHDCFDSAHRETAWQLGSRYEMSRQWSLKANLGQQLRLPTLGEKFGDLGNYIGDPNLAPESSDTADIGLQFANSVLTASMVIYYRDIKDGIYVMYDARGVGHPDNISASQLTGAELSGNWAISDAFSLDLSAYTMDSENLSDVKADRGKLLHGIYHNGYRLALAWSSACQQVVTAFQMDDDLYYTSSNSVAADRRESLDVDYSYRLHAWTFSAGVQNLLDHDFSDYNRMPDRGRFFHTSIHYEFN